MSWVAIAFFGALCWGHGYTRARMRDASMRELVSRAYMRGRRDERAAQEREAVL